MKARIKKSIICKEVREYKINRLFNRHYQPKAGDVGIFRVLEIGKHKAVQGAHGKNTYIFPGDLIMAAFGNRYASNQFEGYVPDGYQEELHILGMGGVVGTVASTHAKLEDVGPTRVKLVGYATHGGSAVINTHYLACERTPFEPNRHRPYQVILSVGASMDSGKTTSAAHLCRGLRHAGRRVAFFKLTGTVHSKDKHFVKDCGAEVVADFSSLGYPSTYMYTLPDLLDVFEGLSRLVERVDPEYVVVEIADGLLQRETKMLLESPLFRSQVDEVMLSCADSLSVMTGLNLLSGLGLEPFAVSGLLNTSPLMVQEVKQSISLPVLSLEDLGSKQVIRFFENRASKIAG